MLKRRILLLASFILLFICIYILQLSNIQLFSTTHFGNEEINLYIKSVEKRGVSLILDDGRGRFLYSDGRPIVYTDKRVVAIFPFAIIDEELVVQLSNLTGVDTSILEASLYPSNQPYFLKINGNLLELSERQFSELNERQYTGVYAVLKQERLGKRTTDHLIGITGENVKLIHQRYPNQFFSMDTLVGLTGLERSFDYFLIGAHKSKLTYYQTNKNEALFGPQVKYIGNGSSLYPINVVTTIKEPFQNILEAVMYEAGIKKGGAILLDIETSEVVASVSLPDINHNNPFTNGVENEMLSEQIIGSVFKTVIAAAAIENVPDVKTRLFDCNKTIYGKEDTNYQYGMLGFELSFAKSCNNTFGILANNLYQKDKNIIEHYANDLGLIGKNVWSGQLLHLDDFKQMKEEDEGRVFLQDDKVSDSLSIAQTGIGQQEVRATPLGVANMMATIARGGEKRQVLLVKELQFKNGSRLASFSAEGEQTISPITAMKLQLLLRGVIVNGTGRSLQKATVEIAGKTGTAQTGKFEGEKQLYNKWMAGYFPYNKPKYSLVVVSLETSNSNENIQTIFEELTNRIMEYKIN